MLKRITVIVAVLTLLCGGAALAGGDDTTALGKKLVENFWRLSRERQEAALAQMVTPGFQSLHQDGGRDRTQELALLAKVDLGPYELSELKSTRQGPVILVTYLVTATETLGGQRLVKKTSARLTAFIEQDGRWLLLAHANTAPMK